MNSNRGVLLLLLGASLVLGGFPSMADSGEDTEIGRWCYQPQADSLALPRLLQPVRCQIDEDTNPIGIVDEIYSAVVTWPPGQPRQILCAVGRLSYRVVRRPLSEWLPASWRRTGGVDVDL
jgi:hypothetical protein